MTSAAVTVIGNKIYDNGTGIFADTYYGTNVIANNLIYDSTSRGIQLNNVQSSGGTMSLTNNTVMELNADAIQITGTSQNVILKNNILWSGGAGHYAINVADGAQRGFSSDYNDLYFTNGAKLGLWQNAFSTLADWRYELGFDSPLDLSADPQFADPLGADGVRGAADSSRPEVRVLPQQQLHGHAHGDAVRPGDLPGPDLRGDARRSSGGPVG